MDQVKIFGKRSHKSEHVNMWRGARWPFVGTILKKGTGSYGWRLKLHENFQSTSVLSEDTEDSLEGAQEALDRAATQHIRALMWFTYDD